MAQDQSAARVAPYRELWGNPASVLRGAESDVPRVVWYDSNDFTSGR